MEQRHLFDVMLSKPVRKLPFELRTVTISTLGILLLLILTVAYLYLFQRPRIIVALGYKSGVHFLEPLQEEKTGFVSMVLGDAGSSNWDGQWLFVDGFCGNCGKPFATKGAIVLALLPNGLAYATNESPRYNHLTRPRFICSNTMLSIIMSFLSTTLFMGPYVFYRTKRRMRIRTGNCPKCNYNLTGNTSGICPECGTPIPKEIQEKLSTDPPKQ